MGQELHSCDTTQIDVLETSARFTRHHACPMDNGWVPVGIYLDRSVQAALESPFTRPRPALIPPSKALFMFPAGTGLLCRLLLFLTGLSAVQLLWLL